MKIPITLLPTLLITVACCAPVTARDNSPSSASSAPPFHTLADWMLDEESKVVPLPPKAHETLNLILTQVRAQIHFNPAETDPALRRKNALAALDQIDRILMENHIVFPPGNWIDSLGQGFEPHTLTDSEYEGVLNECFSTRRAQFIQAHRHDTFYFMDCDVNSFLYVACGQVIGLDLKLIEVPHHMFVRYYLDDKTYFNWETTIPTVKTDDDYRQAAGDEITDWSIVEGAYLTPRTDIEARGYFYGCRGLRCEHTTPPNYTQAAADYQKAITLCPTDAISRNNLAWLYVSVPNFWHGSKLDAVQLALRAVSLDPADGESLDTLACAYAELGNFPKAIAYELEAIDRFQPTDPRAANDKSDFEQRLAAFRNHKTYLQVKPPETQPN